MANAPVNATGWSELMDGNMVHAVYTMFDTAFGGMGIVIILLFFVYQLMLYWKTRNLTLMWIIGILFVALYSISSIYEPFAMRIIFLILVLELGGILYLVLFAKWKKEK